MLIWGAAARRTLSASATTSGPMPSPPMTASLIVGEPMPEPYWRVGPAGGVPGAAAAAPPLSRRSSATCTALMAGSGFAVSSAECLGQGYMSYTRGTPDREQNGTYGQHPTPQRVAGLPRSGPYGFPLRLVTSTKYRIVPATLPDLRRSQTALKTPVSVCETIFLRPSSSGRERILKS